LELQDTLVAHAILVILEFIVEFLFAMEIAVSLANVLLPIHAHVSEVEWDQIAK